MTNEPARVGAEWLRLREPADSAARTHVLVNEVRANLPPGELAVIHDLGCGSGSMARWLAGQLAAPQHWVMHDWDAELLSLAAADPPGSASNGAPVSIETRRADITRLDPEELAGATLVTASALLDMMTARELDRFVVTCAAAGCPVLIALSVTGQVELTPSDPFDRVIADAFNAHQRRDRGAGRLLGPDAVSAAVDGFTRLGLEVRVEASPWRLGPDQAALVTQWFIGWVSAACEQRPELRVDAASYAERRLAQAASGRLSVTVEHQDLLAQPT